MMKLIRVLAIVASPFVILWFMVTHPRKVWEQARKDYRR
jgi:hypothetical protein